jgi:hypothetical protein
VFLAILAARLLASQVGARGGLRTTLGIDA